MPDQLMMTFDPKTVEHLGIKMYSRLPNAIAELIANAYDADATDVMIRLHDADDCDKHVIVEDNGTGMTFNEINEKFLRIGRDRREAGDVTSPSGRIATGRKGLGKLAFFGIGKTIEIVTSKKGRTIKFTMDWDGLLTTPAHQDYLLVHESCNCGPDVHGTRISLSRLKRRTMFDANALTRSLARLFNFADSNFIVRLVRNDEAEIYIDSRLKYEDIDAEFEWGFPDFAATLDSDYEYRERIKGRVIAAKRPLSPRLRGITLYANGRLVNTPEFFGRSESSHFFSYATGWLDVDFIDSWKIDPISTNRQSIDWEQEGTAGLRRHLQSIIELVHRNWRERRQKKRRKMVSDETGVDIDKWYKALPEDIETKVTSVVKKVVVDSELPQADQANVISTIHELVPEL